MLNLCFSLIFISISCFLRRGPLDGRRAKIRGREILRRGLGPRLREAPRRPAASGTNGRPRELESSLSQRPQRLSANQDSLDASVTNGLAKGARVRFGRGLEGFGRFGGVWRGLEGATLWQGRLVRRAPRGGISIQVFFSGFPNSYIWVQNRVH